MWRRPGSGLSVSSAQRVLWITRISAHLFSHARGRARACADTRPRAHAQDAARGRWDCCGFERERARRADRTAVWCERRLTIPRT
eukprot:3074860-Pleurochrysis_carterae.AAC.1